MLAFVHLALMSDAADIDRVRQDLVDVPPTEQSAAGRAATAIDADRKPNALSVELLFEAHHASRFEIAVKQRPHDCRMILDDVQGAILDPVAQRNHAAHPHSLLLRSSDLVPDPLPVTSRSNWAKDSSTLRVRRPMLVVVLKDWVTETKETPWASNVSTNLAKSASERVSRSTL